MIAGGQITLFVKDVGAAVRFYVETLGMKLVEEGAESVVDAGDGLHIALVRDEGSAAARVPVLELSPRLPLDEVVAILANRGVAFEPASSVKGSRAGAPSATFHDPDGNLLRLRPRGGSPAR